MMPAKKIDQVGKDYTIELYFAENGWVSWLFLIFYNDELLVDSLITFAHNGNLLA